MYFLQLVLAVFKVTASPLVNFARLAQPLGFHWCYARRMFDAMMLLDVMCICPSTKVLQSSSLTLFRGYRWHSEDFLGDTHHDGR